MLWHNFVDQRLLVGDLALYRQALERDPAGALLASLNDRSRDRILERDDALRMYLEDLEDTAFKTLELFRGHLTEDESDGGAEVYIRERDQFEYDEKEHKSEEAYGGETEADTQKQEEFGEIPDNDEGEEKEVGKRGCVEKDDGKKTGEKNRKGAQGGVVEKEAPRRDWWND